MRRQTQVILYNLLPATFWVLAIGCSFASFFIWDIPWRGLWGYLTGLLLLIVVEKVRRIERHTSSEPECFLLALFLGIMSYQTPTVVFLVVPFWVYLYAHNLFPFRSFMATFLGYGAVAIWAAVFYYLGWIGNPWADFFATDYLWGWIPLGSMIVAWVASTIARQNLRVR